MGIKVSNFNGLYNIRNKRTDGDDNLILSTFLRGMYYGESWFSLIPKNIFMSNYKKVAEFLVKGDKTIIRIACLPDDENVILGYSITNLDSTVLHYVFVKTAWRKKGIARSLIPNKLVAVSHLTNLGKELLTKLPETVFNPFL